jgi:1-acyl-sn-glycerol-3-phosphate acyltransferase
MYWWLARFFRFLVGRLYRLEILGRPVPSDGPLILVGNHPNGLMDPALMLQVSDRELRFLAKEPLFRMPVLGAIIKGMRALPIFRAQDGHDTDANQRTFAAVHAALANGNAIVVFPEGKSHNESNTQRLKTGAARMALGTAPGANGDVRIVPIGFNYADKARFRSSVALVIGEPIEVSEFRTEGGAEDRDAVGALTDRVGRDLQRVTIQLEDWEELPLLRVAERVWNPAPKRARGHRLAVLSHAAKRLRAEDPDRFKTLRKRVEDLAETLDRVGVPTSPVHPLEDRRLRPAQRPARAARPAPGRPGHRHLGDPRGPVQADRRSRQADPRRGHHLPGPGRAGLLPPVALGRDALHRRPTRLDLGPAPRRPLAHALLDRLAPVGAPPPGLPRLAGLPAHGVLRETPPLPADPPGPDRGRIRRDREPLARAGRAGTR